MKPETIVRRIATRARKVIGVAVGDYVAFPAEDGVVYNVHANMHDFDGMFCQFGSSGDPNRVIINRKRPDQKVLILDNMITGNPLDMSNGITFTNGAA